MKKIILLFFLFITGRMLACDCPPLEPISEALCKKYDLIFDAKIDSVAPCGTDGDGIAYFTIISLYKGSAEQHIAVSYDCRSACMMSFAAGEEWIIYAIYSRFNKAQVDLCSHSRKRITGGTADYYEAASQRSFGQENDWLKSSLGIQPYAQHNALNDQEKSMAPHNDQPSAMGKIWLLLVSLAAMLIVYVVSKKYFKNGP